MFTGIISGLGTIRSVGADTQERELVIETSYADIVLGESVAVNGTCLTVAKLSNSTLTFYASRETCDRTNLGQLEQGSQVNLERALRLSDRLSGHLVQGHVDGLGSLVAIQTTGDSHEIQVKLPAAMARYTIEKGSIALDGISLTINSINNSILSLMIIPHTWQHTTLALKQVGQDFNVELDMIAKYVEKLRGPE